MFIHQTAKMSAKMSISMDYRVHFSSSRFGSSPQLRSNLWSRCGTSADSVHLISGKKTGSNLYRKPSRPSAPRAAQDCTLTKRCSILKCEFKLSLCLLLCQPIDGKYVQRPMRHERHLICRSRETPRAAALPSQRQPAESRGLASGIIDEDISQKRFR